MKPTDSEIVNQKIVLYFRADALKDGFAETGSGRIAGTRWIEGIVKEINSGGLLLELTKASTIGDLVFETGTLFFPWSVVGLLYRPDSI